ncbi:MAG TPA: cupin domain-containing protein [Mycobacteriales bacterium]|jgi:quercetin dioxygenase-like cupin family protein/catechol 2,3-dioxygenase-like lactoylglutathione lyase family enzyme|nr:cupin domain-containing protein [Mycobacteriales bacterium]
MTVTSAPTQIGDREIASEPATSRAWWFLGTLLVLRNPEGAPVCPAVMELTIPPGGSPPEHVHESLDDSFYLLDGELVIRCGDRTIVARPGSYVVLPHGIGHTFRVTSRVPARLLLVHADDSFLRFVQAVGTPTDDRRLPPHDEFDLDFETLSRASAEHGAPMIGPSLEEDEARRHLPPGSDAPTLGSINHIALCVTDLARSERWYREAFDLVRIDGEIADDGTGHVTLLSPTGGWILALAGAPAAEVQHVAVSCADREKLVRWRGTLTDRGVAPGTITDAPYGSGFVVRDPDGIELELFAAAQQHV